MKSGKIGLIFWTFPNLRRHFKEGNDDDAGRKVAQNVYLMGMIEKEALNFVEDANFIRDVAAYAPFIGLYVKVITD